MDKFNILSDFTEYQNVFLTENSKINLISKKDTQNLYSKHIYDSLAIKLFFEKYTPKIKDLLDIGCGGGFPCIPIAIEYPELNVVGIDSVRKKINAINNIKNKLNLQNLSTICARVETIHEDKFDIVTSRAVAELSVILQYGLPLLRKNGFFVAYKSKKVQEELITAKVVLQKYNAKVLDIIEYELPTADKHERNLVIITI